MITEKQKQLLSELDNIIIKLAGECEEDNNFNSYLGNLDIFKNDLLEISCTIAEELENL